MKGWFLRQPARSRHEEDITPERAWQRESRSRDHVSYRERLGLTIAKFCLRKVGDVEISRCQGGSCGFLEKAWPVVNEHTENGTGD